MEKRWWKESVVYQIYPRSFKDSNGDGIGDIRGITEKLDYLKLLGIDVIWLSPMYQSPNDDNGYDISDYQAIMSDFGTMEDFDEMLNKAHQLGIRIMMDLVVNHSSDEHKWFIESRKSKDNPYRDYYIWKPGKEDGQPPNNWYAEFGGSAWKYDEATDEYYLHLFSEKQPDLNWESPTLRNEVFNLMKFWLDKGVDGFRMDVISFISKDQRFPDAPEGDGYTYRNGAPFYTTGPRIHEYLHSMNKEVLSHYDTITVGEAPGVSPEEAQLYTGDDREELNMIFQFEHVELGEGKYGKWTPTPWKLTDLKRIFGRWQKGLEKRGWNSLFWNNHDQPRSVSRWGNDNEEYRELSGKMLATCLHMMQGTPYIYQGEEIGMTNVKFESINDYRDIETLNAYRDYVGQGLLSHDEMMDGLHKRSRDNARTPVQWNDKPNAGFSKGEPWIPLNPNYKEINVDKVLSDPNSIFYYYQKLTELRKQNDIIVYGTYDLLLKEDEKIYAYTRTLNNEKLLVVCNFTQEVLPFNSGLELNDMNKELLISNYDVNTNDNIDNFTLKPYEARVYKLTNS